MTVGTTVLTTDHSGGEPVTLTRHAAVRSALRDRRLEAAGAPVLRRLGIDWMLNHDGRLQQLWHRRFGAALRPPSLLHLRDVVDARAAELARTVRLGGEVDIVTRFAFPLPIDTIRMVLGTTELDAHQVHRWWTDLMQAYDPRLTDADLPAIERSAAEFRAAIEELVVLRRREPRDDLVTRLLEDSSTGDGGSDEAEELVGNLILAVGAGFETTMGLISNGVLLLLGAPDQAEEVRRTVGSGGLQRAVEEVLRFESPIRSVARVATERIELDGVVVEEGHTVILDLALANRDPERFERPDVFDVSRVENPHLAFGGGPHFCVGAGLARLEGAVALGAILHLLPELELVEGGLVWKDHPTVHCPATLMVRRRT